MIGSSWLLDHFKHLLVLGSVFKGRFHKIVSVRHSEKRLTKYYHDGPTKCIENWQKSN